MYDYFCSAGGLLEPANDVAVIATEKLKDLSKQVVRGQRIFKTANYAKEVRNKLEPKMAELIKRINIMMQGINRVIAPKQLLLVVDDLDKADYQCIKQIFIQHLEAIFHCVLR